MKSKNNKQPQQRRRRARNAPKRPNKPVLKRQTAITKPMPNVKMLRNMICAYNDPFCEHARGARLHEGASIKSLAYTLRKTITMPTHFSSASGTYDGAFLYLPAFGTLGHLSTSGSTPPNYAWNNVVSAGITLTPTAYRLVSVGILIRNPNAPLTMQGMVRIRTFAQTTGSTFGLIDGTTSNYAQKLDVPLRDVHELAVISKVLDPMVARKFTPVGSTYSTLAPTGWTTPGYTPIMVSLDGAGSYTTLEIELFANYEIIFSDDDSMSTIAIQSPPANATLTTVAAQVQSKAESIFMQGAKQAGAFIVKTGSAMLAGAIGEMIGGPALGIGAANTTYGAIGYAIDVD